MLGGFPIRYSRHVPTGALSAGVGLAAHADDSGVAEASTGGRLYFDGASRLPNQLPLAF